MGDARKFEADFMTETALNGNVHNEKVTSEKGKKSGCVWTPDMFRLIKKGKSKLESAVSAKNDLNDSTG